MGLFKRIIKGELIDIIEFLDTASDSIVHRFERRNNEIKNNAKLIVREGQAAVFINEGRLADVFAPGTYRLNTQNLPILSTLQGWKYGFESPFKAEVYFVSTKNFLDQKWGTRNPLILRDDRFGLIEIRAYGTYSFKVTDAGLFVREIVGTQPGFSTKQIADQLKSVIVTRFSDAAGELSLPVEMYASRLNELSSCVFDHIHNDFSGYGIEVTKFLIENVSMPEAVKKEIFELSRLQAVDLDKFQKLKTAKAIETAAGNSSGSAGIGMGLGAGAAMAAQMVQAMPGVASPAGHPQSTPPPVPRQILYYAVLNGEQAGPYERTALEGLARENKIDRETFLWKAGLAEWQEAGSFGELDGIWGAVPPPIPGQR